MTTVPSRPPRPAHPVGADAPSRPALARVLPGPLGPMVAVADESALLALWFAGDDDPGVLRERLARRLGRGIELGESAILARAGEALATYFAGDLRAIDARDLPLDPPGTRFQHRVWAELRRIPAGQTHSYADLACALDKPTATRAVAAANADNPIAIFVPCHRVIGRDGTLTGYAGGLWRKEWLLKHEGSRLV